MPRGEERPSDKDLMAAAFEAGCRQWEKQTGRDRVAMFAEMAKDNPIAAEVGRDMQDHYSEMMRNR